MKFPNRKKIRVVRYAIGTAKASFSIVTINLNMWNFLPEHVVNAPSQASVDSFKNRLDKQWSNEETKQPYQQDANPLALHRLEHKI